MFNQALASFPQNDFLSDLPYFTLLYFTLLYSRSFIIYVLCTGRTTLMPWDCDAYSATAGSWVLWMYYDDFIDSWNKDPRSEDLNLFPPAEALHCASKELVRHVRWILKSITASFDWSSQPCIRSRGMLLLLDIDENNSSGDVKTCQNIDVIGN